MIVCIAPYESGIGWQSLTAAQGNCLMAFTGALRFFNSEFTLPEQRAAFLGGNAPLGLTAQNLDELVVWLSLDVSNSDAACKASWSGLYEFVKQSTDEFVTLSSSSVNDRDTVADLLTEVLRVCNFTQHDKNIISQFLTIMTRCGIVVTGDPEVCKAYATFKSLGYSKTSHQVTMSSK
jgi:hypothetical protein